MKGDKSLSFEEAMAKAVECRDVARRAERDEHKIMLEHVAKTWERIAASFQHHRRSS